MNPIIQSDIETILSHPLPWEFFRDQTILVSGAAGLLPSYMVETLLAMRRHLGFGPRRVIGLVRTLSKAQRRFAPHSERADLSLVAGDVAAPPHFGGPIDIIIHAASIANSAQMLRDPAGTLTANVLGTHHLLELARAKQSANFLFFSSGEVCGAPTPDQIPMREDRYFSVDPADVRACYAEGKRIGETMCSAWSRQYGLETRIVRPFHTYGPGMDLYGGWIFSDFVRDIMAGRELVIKSDGLATRSFCYIADAVLAYFTVMLKGQNATAYNVGTGIETSLKALAECLVEEFAERGLSYRLEPPPPDLARPATRSVPDITRLKSLGWQPMTPINKGFRRTVESYEIGQFGTS